MPEDYHLNHVLIADDDLDDQMLLQEVMHDIHPSVKITHASDGMQLMQLLKSGAVPDLLLLDLNMPYKSGLECLADIRADRTLGQLPVVIFSTSKAIRDMELSFATGAQLFLSKPCSFEGLKKMVGDIFVINWSHFPESLSRHLFLKIAAEGSIESIYQEI